MATPVDPESEPPNKDPEYVALWDQYKILKKDNARSEQELVGRYGPTAKLDWQSAIEARIESVLDAVLPTDSVPRIKMEIEWQELMRSSLTNLRNKIIETIRQREQEAKQSNAVAEGHKPELWKPPATESKLIIPGK